MNRPHRSRPMEHGERPKMSFGLRLCCFNFRDFCKGHFVGVLSASDFILILREAFPGHRGAISCFSLGWGITELFSGSFGRSIRIWNAEDRAFIAPLFGHQSESLTIDCLRKEWALTVGRDRTMQLYKLGNHGSNRTEEELETHTILAWKDGKSHIIRQTDGDGG
ncbi:hypothetical protein Dimus_035600, partial [Dionaea muscipula]